MSIIKGYKGFDKDLKCRDFQYEIGKEYETDKKPEICRQGFHFCEYPLDIFNYYLPSQNARFAEVEGDGSVSKESGGDTKIACSKIKIGLELNLSSLIRSAVKFVFERAKWSEGSSATGDYGAASATGRRGAASATGWRGAASATGDRGAASATGWRGAASATGEQGAASATREQGAASATGNRGAASATGDYGAASATGDYGAASATGRRGAASATGWRGAASATGWRGAASATGDRGAASATGEQGAASATGDRGAASATGWRGAASATGPQGAASAICEEGVASALGIDGKAKAKKGGFLVLAEWKEDKKTCIWHRTNVLSVLVDGKKIKEDVYYELKKGKFVKSKDQ